MKLDTWLDANITRVAELFTVNGNRMAVEGHIGQSVPTDKNRYGRLGLTIPEAFEITYYRGVLDGLTNAEPNPPMKAREVMGRLTSEAQGQVIQMVSPEQLKHEFGVIL